MATTIDHAKIQQELDKERNFQKRINALQKDLLSMTPEPYNMHQLMSALIEVERTSQVKITGLRHVLNVDPDQ